MKNALCFCFLVIAVSACAIFGIIEIQHQAQAAARRELALPHNDSYPRRCAVDAQSHIQIRVFSYGGKLFGICGSCGDWIPLRLDFGTNATQATLETVPRIEIQYEH